MVKMDVNDRHVALGFKQRIMKSKKVVLAGQARKGLPLTWTESRDALLQRYETVRRNLMGQNLNLRSMFVPPAYLPCAVSFSDLTKIMMKDLRFDTHHSGNFLIVRCIAPPCRLINGQSVVEDECGDAIKLTLRHQDEDCFLDEILGEGMILAVKELYLRSTSDGFQELIVDHVSNFRNLSMRDSLTPALWQKRRPKSEDKAEIWNIEGNDLVAEERYFSAIRRYVLQIILKFYSRLI